MVWVMFWRTLYCNSKVMFFLCEFWCQVQGKASTNLKISSCCKDCWFAAWSIILGCFEGVNSVHSESFVTTNHTSKVPGAVVDRWGKVISVWSRWNELKRAVGDLVCTVTDITELDWNTKFVIVSKNFLVPRNFSDISRKRSPPRDSRVTPVSSVVS